jgi:hypothetical protein
MFKSIKTKWKVKIFFFPSVLLLKRVTKAGAGAESGNWN